MAVLIDTNIFVYRYDARFSRKQQIAKDILRSAIDAGDARVPHQVVVEFVAATTRGRPGTRLLSAREALHEADDILAQFPIIYPNEAVLRTALRGLAAYGLSWFDAHLWAYAEVFGLTEIISEDFAHGRLYGSVMVRNPFVQVQ
ncbi:MAG: PIN domain-containing protein [Bryobacterales bacterium]|nr:PIN domain-containing protein [Bryobacterales bacterium]MDE0263311.1 PIN domain-containing protein [Bryobacterales bacterium]MDE0624327.1 PIN domain-containing protein [Bryobacterales bacterium]